MPDRLPPSLAERVAARRAVQEAAALRANLHRRKRQARAAEKTLKTDAKVDVAESTKPCR